MDDATTPGIVERVDHLTAAVADMAFKLETLISSTTAFRESFGERMTDYADLVAHWSLEAEQNLADQRRMTENVGAAVAKAESRLLEAIEGVTADLGQSDALAAVLAEVTRARRELPDAVAAAVPPPPELPPFPEMPAVDLSPLSEIAVEVKRLRDELPEIVATVSPTADLTPLADEVRGLRRDMARFPDDRAEIEQLRDGLAAVLAEVTAARRELPEVVAALPVPEIPEVPELPAPVDIAPLAAEVRQLRDALLAEAGAAEEDDTTLAEAVGAELTALRAEMKVLQDRVTERPPVPPEVEALTAELKALRTEMDAEPAADAPSAAPDPLHDTLAELVYEVKALRRRFPVKAPPGEPDPSADEPPPVPPKRGARKPR